jgi:hypothetical protein
MKKCGGTQILLKFLRIGESLKYKGGNVYHTSTTASPLTLKFTVGLSLRVTSMMKQLYSVDGIIENYYFNFH